MALLVTIQVAPQYEPLIDEQVIRRAVEHTVAHQGWQEMGEVVIVITDDGGTQDLNRQFRGLDAPTDVLSFPGGVSENFVTPPGYSGYLGDVVISYTRAEVQAHQAGHSVERELQILTVHGLLHLFGFEDEDEESWQRTMEAQNAILSSLPLPPPSAPRQTTGTAIG